MTLWAELLGSTVRWTADTRVIESGEGSPLLLLHGQGGHAENFRYNIPAYAKSFRVLAPDMRWHGLSDKRGVPSQLIVELGEHVLRLLDEEAIETCFIEGQSLGGWVATRLVLAHPERFRGLVLTTPMGVGAAKVIDPEMLTEWREAQHRALGNVTAEAIRGRMSSLFADPANLDDEIVAVREKIYNDRATNASLRNVATAYFDPAEAARQTVYDEDLARISIPTLVYWSDHNDPFSVEVGEAIAAAIPGARYHCATAGHWAQYENSDEHNRIVLDFLNGIGA